MPGPPPSDGPVRQRANGKIEGFAANAMKLPRSGRTGEPPAWPLPDDPSEDELEAWATAWATPQAFAWERLGWVRPVARYVRCLVESERRGAPAALLAEVRQMEDRLGLSPMAILRLRWTIVDELPAEQVRPAAASTRSRLRVVS